MSGSLGKVSTERARGEEEEESDKESGSQEQASIMPTYLGVLFETVEVFVYTIAVGHSSVNGYLAPALGGIIGYVIPWFGAVYFREQIEGFTEWKRETGIGVVLISAAVIFSVLRYFRLL